MNSSKVSVKRVLIAPLDWGLGHATRCIPVIQKLAERGHQVFLAGESTTQSLLQTEFPELPFLHLPGYGIRYGASALQTTLALLRQLPKISKAITKEHQWLQEAMKKYRFDALISDNRYGLHHPGVYSVFMTHQLGLKAPVAAVAWLAQTWMYAAIEKFDACWVPDFASEPSLAGGLSHPQKKPNLPVHYVGPLSRFKVNKADHHKSGVLLLLSGPEPQRTVFENILLEQAPHLTQSVALVRGLPGAAAVLKVPPNVQVFNHLPSAELSVKISGAGTVVCRSGYSSVMDLAALRQKSILVPTPGQTEQEYLARHLQQQGFAMWRRQSGFDLHASLQAAASFPYHFLEMPDESLLTTAVAAMEKALL